jgi:subtilase family serine protease
MQQIRPGRSSVSFARRLPQRRPAALLLAALLALPAGAGATDLIRLPIDPSVRATLPGRHVAGWAKAQADLGRVPDQTPLTHLSLLLERPPERQQAFERLLREQHDPASPNYRRWLTPTEIGERFGASPADIKAVSAWLRAQGLAVDGVSNSRTRIRFSGRAADVAAAFGTELRYFEAAGQRRIANTQAPTLPAALAGAVRSVAGLNTLSARPAHHMTPARLAAGPRPAATSCSGGTCLNSLFPADFATIYDVPRGPDGSGQTIGIIARQRVYEADVKNFLSLAGLPVKYPVVVVPPQGTDPGPPATTCSETGTPSCDAPSDAVSDQGEATLDVQRAGSVAPGATVKLITSGRAGNTDGVYVALDYAIDADPVPAHILSVSYTSCEADNTQAAGDVIDAAFQQAAMEGISIFVASGDGGVAGCASLDSAPTATQRVSTNVLCASGYATCVGGTEFADKGKQDLYWGATGDGYGSALGYIPEGAWNEPLNAAGDPQVAATGGGYSIYVDTPAWQTGVGVPGSQGRYTPDVSFNASVREGYFTCVAAQGASCEVVDGSFRYLLSGGTSASAPSMAGIAALLNQQAGGAQGNLNPRLYALAADPANGVFHDVTVASSGVAGCNAATPSPCNNSTPGPGGLSGGLAGYLVGTGYDLATGLGSIDVAKLLEHWDASAAVELNQHGLTGSWANPETSGQGIVMEVDPDFYGAGSGLLFGGWYTYDATAAGGQRWYTLQATVGGATASVPIYLTTGGRFHSAQATTTAPVGQATLAFSDCMHGTLTYAFTDGSGRSGSIPLTRLTSNVTCSPSGDSGAATPGYLLAGSWADIADSGQGLVLDVNVAQNVLFAGWYTYAADAAPGSGAAAQRWYTLQSTYAAGAATLDDVGIYETTGGAFDRPAPTSTVRVGNARLAFHSCSSATLDYAFTSGANAGRSGTLQLSRLGAVPDGCRL